jgi:hypothetical protein
MPSVVQKGKATVFGAAGITVVAVGAITVTGFNLTRNWDLDLLKDNENEVINAAITGDGYDLKIDFVPTSTTLALAATLLDNYIQTTFAPMNKVTISGCASNLVNGEYNVMPPVDARFAPNGRVILSVPLKRFTAAQSTPTLLSATVV